MVSTAARQNCRATRLLCGLYSVVLYCLHGIWKVQCGGAKINNSFLQNTSYYGDFLAHSKYKKYYVYYVYKPRLSGRARKVCPLGAKTSPLRVGLYRAVCTTVCMLRSFPFGRVGQHWLASGTGRDSLAIVLCFVCCCCGPSWGRFWLLITQASAKNERRLRTDKTFLRIDTKVCPSAVHFHFTVYCCVHVQLFVMISCSYKWGNNSYLSHTA